MNLEDLATRFGASHASAYRARRDGPGWKLTLFDHRGFQPGDPRRLEAYFATASHDALPYDPESVPVSQRDVVVRIRQRYSAEHLSALPIVRDLLAPLGLDGHDQMRVLVCDDAGGLVAWVGLFRLAPFTAAEQGEMQELVPSLRAWLIRAVAASTPAAPERARAHA